MLQFNALGQILPRRIFFMLQAEWIFPEHRPPRSWPSSGDVRFTEYITRYRPGLDLVLRGIGCSIQDGEKVTSHYV